MDELPRELPESTFALTRNEVPGFVRELQERFGISIAAEEICIRALRHLFVRYGGFKEQPTEENAVWMPYHNGSHAAYVMAVGVYLAHIDGHSTETKDAIAVGGVYHDWYHHFKEPEKNERESAGVMSRDLRKSSLASITARAEASILGTIVTRIGKDGIQQRAQGMHEETAQYMADADLASLVAPNAAAWALRLQIEHEVADGNLKCTHEDIMNFYAEQAIKRMKEFLSVSQALQQRHHFLSPAGQRLLQPLLATRAAEFENIMDEKHPLDYFGSRKDLNH